MPRLQFQLEAVAAGSRARAATFRTLHGTIETPLFMPVGTQATVRTQTVETLEAAGSRMLLANTYHLLRQPGPEVFRRMGGIHKLMTWSGSVLTDSGGFQIFSLSHTLNMTEKGALFKRHPDEAQLLLTPELSIDMQKAIGSDVMMVLDECVPATVDRSIAEAAMHRTHRWALRSLQARGDSPQALFAIVQGACFSDLRHQSAAVLTDLPFDGYAIGGLAVGETREQREQFTELTTDRLPVDLPRYLMGVGTPIDLLEGVHRGVDMFDCIIPNALAQRGIAYTSSGVIKLHRSVYRLEEAPLDAACGCPTCIRYSRAYLNHLIKAREVLGWQLVSTHNLHFYHQLMRDIRRHILQGTFEGFYREAREWLAQEDEAHPAMPPRRRRRHRPLPRELGPFELLEGDDGFARIRHRASSEVIHPGIDPSAEAERLYVAQSGLEARLRVAGPPLVVWDVGLGAATNAMAVVGCLERLAREEGASIRPLHLVSFETELDALRLALHYPTRFKHLQHGAPHRLLAGGHWASQVGPLTWTLLEGDFLARLGDAPMPDLVYFDPFSFRTDSPLWTLGCFRQMAGAFGARPVTLLTYSMSTAARAGLLAAGFFVFRGQGVGAQAEATVAMTPAAWDQHNAGALSAGALSAGALSAALSAGALSAGAVPIRDGGALLTESFVVAGPSAPLLGLDWLVRWERSQARWPAHVAAAELPELERALRSHPQLDQAPMSADPAVGQGLFDASISLHTQGRFEEALWQGRRAERVWAATLGNDHPRVGKALESCALYLRALGRIAEAEETLEQALRLRGRRGAA